MDIGGNICYYLVLMHFSPIQAAGTGWDSGKHWVLAKADCDEIDLELDPDDDKIIKIVPADWPGNPWDSGVFGDDPYSVTILGNDCE
jgi:hypothetical protein